MFSTRLVFSRHSLFPTQYQTFLQLTSYNSNNNNQLNQQPDRSQPFSLFMTSSSPQLHDHPFSSEKQQQQPKEPKTPKPHFLKRLDMKLEAQRKELEEKHLRKHEQGQSSRLTPSMQKKFEDFQNMEKNLEKRELL
jgi:hypothetical protein